MYPHIVKYIKEPTPNAIKLAVEMKPVLAKLFPAYQSNAVNNQVQQPPQ